MWTCSIKDKIWERKAQGKKNAQGGAGLVLTAQKLKWPMSTYNISSRTDANFRRAQISLPWRRSSKQIFSISRSRRCDAVPILTDRDEFTGTETRGSTYLWTPLLALLPPPLPFPSPFPRLLMCWAHGNWIEMGSRDKGWWHGVTTRPGLLRARS